MSEGFSGGEPFLSTRAGARQTSRSNRRALSLEPALCLVVFRPREQALELLLALGVVVVEPGALSRSEQFEVDERSLDRALREAKAKK